MFVVYNQNTLVQCPKKMQVILPGGLILNAMVRNLVEHPLLLVGRLFLFVNIIAPHICLG